MNGEIGKASSPWNNYSVIVEKRAELYCNFEHKIVCSKKYALEISWMFEQLHEIFKNASQDVNIDLKEMYGSLGCAAIRGIHRNNENCKGICLEILKDAYCSYCYLTSAGQKIALETLDNSSIEKKDYIDFFEDLSDIVSGNLSSFREDSSRFEPKLLSSIEETLKKKKINSKYLLNDVFLGEVTFE